MHESHAECVRVGMSALEVQRVYSEFYSPPGQLSTDCAASYYGLGSQRGYVLTLNKDQVALQDRDLGLVPVLPLSFIYYAD